MVFTMNLDVRCLAASTIRVALIVLAASQRRCMVNTISCMYSKTLPDGEQLVYSKHVEDDYIEIN